jgi:hypothetical protein
MERTDNRVDSSKVDFFIAVNAGRFDAAMLPHVRDVLLRMTEDQFLMISVYNFRDPILMLAVAFFLGWERFFLDDVTLGIIKVLTCYGLGVWWLIDLFTVIDRTKRYNYDRFAQITSYMR